MGLVHFLRDSHTCLLWWRVREEHAPKPQYRNSFISILIPGRICLCDSVLIRVLMHCTTLHTLHKFSLRMLGAGGDVSTRLQPVVSRKAWRPPWWQGKRLTLMNEDLGSDRAHSLLSLPQAARNAQHMPWESIFGLMKYQVAVRTSQRGFTTGTSRLVSLAAFCAGTVASGDKGTAANIVYLVSEMSFDVVSHGTHLKAEEMQVGWRNGKMD